MHLGTILHLPSAVLVTPRSHTRPHPHQNPHPSHTKTLQPSAAHQAQPAVLFYLRRFNKRRPASRVLFERNGVGLSVRAIRHPAVLVLDATEQNPHSNYSLQYKSIGHGYCFCGRRGSTRRVVCKRHMEGGGVGVFRCEVGMSHQAPKKSEAPLQWKK